MKWSELEELAKAYRDRWGRPRSKIIAGYARAWMRVGPRGSRVYLGAYNYRREGAAKRALCRAVEAIRKAR